MKIKTGCLYHIKDVYFDKFKEENLMSNHYGGGKRPTYFTIQDEDICWFIPLSTKIEKYKKIIANKIKKYGNCDSILIRKIFDIDSVILIQNAFPILPKYIDHVHIKKGRNSNVSHSTQKDILYSFKKLLSMKENGKDLFYTNIDKMKEVMLEEALFDKKILSMKIMSFKVELTGTKESMWRKLELPSFMTISDLVYCVFTSYNLSGKYTFLLFHDGINYKNYREDTDLLYNNFRYANLTKLEDVNFKNKELVLDYGGFLDMLTFKITYLGFTTYPKIADGKGEGIIEDLDEEEISCLKLTEKFDIKKHNKNLNFNYFKIKSDYEDK